MSRTRKDVCLDLLTRGHVNSFTKFFSIKQDEDIAALEALLVSVESSFRTTNDYQIVESCTQLANYFLQLENFENALENYQAALSAAKRIKEYHYEIDALCCYGSALLQSGNYQRMQRTDTRKGDLHEALVNFGKARDLAIYREDKEREHSTLERMMKTTMAMAKDFELEGDHDSAIGCYQKSLDLVKSFDPELEKEDACRLQFNMGSALKKVGKIEAAIKFLETFLENIKKFPIKDNEGNAQLILADCYERSNKQSTAISYLELFISQAQGDPAQRDVESQACNQLGTLYSKQGRHDLAVLYFDRHFHLISGHSKHIQAKVTAMGEVAANDPPKPVAAVSSPILGTDVKAMVADMRHAMVQLGISKANAQMDLLFETVADPSGVHALIQWKNTRSFGDYVPPAHRVLVD
ncbi:hypothetical protein HDV03_005118 [Kappamyces sp. JEL0829]|nr:hypothetical protein HDV03_005118 [Kappamyces sp. JEL0829]